VRNVSADFLLFSPVDETFGAVLFLSWRTTSGKLDPLGIGTFYR
jgi:hypothetical protein